MELREHLYDVLRSLVGKQVNIHFDVEHIAVSLKGELEHDDPEVMSVHNSPNFISFYMDKVVSVVVNLETTYIVIKS